MTDEKQAFSKGRNHMTSRPSNGSLFHRFSESIKGIADSRPHGKYTVQDIDDIIASTAPNRDSAQSDSISDNVDHDQDGDIPMFDLNDETDVEMISEYLSDQRELEVQPMVSSMQRIDDSILLLNPTILKTVFVVDTNFIISHLNTLEKLRTLCNTCLLYTSRCV